MSVSPELFDSSDRKAEKSRFSRKCSLLSQYLKENGSFGDLTLGMTCDGNVPEMHRQAMNFFPNKENHNGALNRNLLNPQNSIRSMDLFPQQAGFSLSSPNPDVQKRADLSNNTKPVTSNPPKAQMTIFYNGQVIVFDDFPAEKAKEVMLLAGKGSCQKTQNISGATTEFPFKNPPVISPNLAKSPIESSTSVPYTSNAIPRFAHKPISRDLPIARRASLHRFLEKRKDRIISRGPYQTIGSMASPSKPVETKSWLGLSAQPSH